uniref:Uncharacterized protein n=1 Tax=Ananas comosus var. bracteatus TaxID=296719 RepID=A0A6V7Q092_ANACO|nr:unnamed protein product [Ananas comosus var. bracteatus]
MQNWTRRTQISKTEVLPDSGAQNIVRVAQKRVLILIETGSQFGSYVPGAQKWVRKFHLVNIACFDAWQGGSSSASTSSVLTRVRRRKIGSRRNLVCWILDFQRNPRSHDSQNLVKVSSVELKFSSAVVAVGRIVSFQQCCLRIRDPIAARNCIRGGCFIGFAPKCIWSLFELDRDTLHTRWVAPMSATPEAGLVLLRWCRSCQLDLLSTDQLVWVEPDSRNGAGTGVFTVPGTEPQVSAAAPSADQDRGKGVAS